MNNITSFFEKRIQQIIPILKNIQSENGISYLVGGAVRDLILYQYDKNFNFLNLDLDIEVHNLSLNKLQIILNKFGHTKLVGKQFGVLKLMPLNIDWSLPRTDSIGRKPKVRIDVNMDIKKALERRDVTINAMAINLNDIINNYKDIITNIKTTNIESLLKITDPFQGLSHLKNKILHPVNYNKFSEDPLRFFRVMQMVSRFEFKASSQMNDLAKSMQLLDPKTQKFNIASERIVEELKKIFIKSKQPSLGFFWLYKINRFQDIFPSLIKIPNIKTNFQNLDLIANLFKNKDEKAKNLDTFIATLTFGLNMKEVKDFFKFFNFGNNFYKKTLSLLKNYKLVLKEPFVENLKLTAYQISPIINLQTLLNFTFFNQQISKNNFIKSTNLAKQNNILTSPEPPLVTGKDLVDKIPPGPKYQELLNLAYKKQILNPKATKTEILDTLQ